MNELESALLAILASHPWFMRALDQVYDLGIPQSCIGAGTIRNIVFDYVDGIVETPTPIRDVDVAYFDAENLSEETDHEYEESLRRQMPEIPWEVTNQAAVHLWFHKAFGYKVPPVYSIEHAVATWPETCTSVAVTKLRRGNVRKIAHI